VSAVLGARIREARLAAGLTQVELGERIGRTQAVVSAWERGERRPSVDALVALAHALGRSTDWLLGLDG